MANKGLGRGLGSLLGILDDEEEVAVNEKKEPQKEIIKEIDGEEVRNIEIGQIDINPNQPRKIFDPTALNELAQSIKIHGVIQPILLTPRNGRYMIVAGERRFRASIIAQIKTIPAIIKDFDEKQVQEIALLENIQRQDLNPIETARALKELQESYGWTQEALADRLGKSRPVIANTLRLLNLCPEVIDLIEKGKLSAGHARSLVVVTNPEVQLKLQKRYPGAIEEIEGSKHICRVLLSMIWTKDYKSYSFPKFKFMLYMKDQELNLVTHYPMTPALCVNISFERDYSSIFKNAWNTLKGFVLKKVQSSEHTAVSEIVDALVEECKFNKYRAQAIVEVVIASMDSYRKNFARSTSPIAQEKTTTEGKTKYQFNVAVNSYFQWVEMGLRKIEHEVDNDKMYLINDNGNRTKEYSVILGILESIGVLTFEMIGGANSQLYIYVNQIQALKNILNAPYRYNNRLLETISERHLISVKMLSYLYEEDFSNAEMWDMLENYFLGSIPEKVKKECKKIKPDMLFD